MALKSDISFTMHGDVELRRALRKLPRKIRGKALRSAIRAGALPIKKAAIARAPNRTGLTRLAIKVRVKTYGDTGTVVAIIGVKTKFGQSQPFKHFPSKVAHLIEFGTVKMSARPFLRPAFVATQADAQLRTIKFLQRAIDREAKKLAAGGSK